MPALRSAVAAAGALLLAAAPVLTAAQQFLPVEPLGGDTNLSAYDMNSGGVVVGCSDHGWATRRAFVWNRATGTTAIPIPGATDSCAWAVNDSGQVVGEASDESGTFAFLWDASGLTKLGPGSARYINPAGTVAGNGRILYDDQGWVSGQENGWMWSPTSGRHELAYGDPPLMPAGIDAAGRVVAGTYEAATDTSALVLFQIVDGAVVATALDTRGQYVAPSAINVRGDVAGNSSDGRPTLVTGTRLIDLGDLGGSWVWASYGPGALNDLGDVTGGSYTPAADPWAEWGEVTHAFLWHDGRMIDLGTLGGPSSEGMAVNNLGQVVGYAQAADRTTHAFSWSGGVMTDLAAPGSHEPTWAVDVNDRGEVLVWDLWGPMRAWVWVPAGPPPAGVTPLRVRIDTLAVTGMIPNGIHDALVASVDAAAARLANGDRCGAVRLLEVFDRKVGAFATSGKLNSSTTNELLQLAADSTTALASSCP